MIYAIREYPSGRKTLIELNKGDLGRVWGMEGTYRFTEEEAHEWVRNGREHETGLFINDDGNVEYAPAEGE